MVRLRLSLQTRCYYKPLLLVPHKSPSSATIIVRVVFTISCAFTDKNYAKCKVQYANNMQGKVPLSCWLINIYLEIKESLRLFNFFMIQ